MHLVIKAFYGLQSASYKNISSIRYTMEFEAGKDLLPLMPEITVIKNTGHW